MGRAYRITILCGLDEGEVLECPATPPLWTFSPTSEGHTTGVGFARDDVIQMLRNLRKRRPGTDFGPVQRISEPLYRFEPMPRHEWIVLANGDCVLAEPEK